MSAGSRELLVLACPPSIGYWEKSGLATLSDMEAAKRSVFVPWSDITVMATAL